MKSDPASSLGPTNAAFALAVGFTVLFNTALACAKDVSPSLLKLMTSVGGHHWTTHAIVDLVVFFLTSQIFLRTGVAARLSAQALLSILIAAVLAASFGLLSWYLVF